jgi:1-acyl-sn-glycerol-3-phosphate acyltransferase
MGHDIVMFKPLEKSWNPLRSLLSRLVGLPFVVLARCTRWDIDGRELLLSVVAEHERTGRGLVTLSNHVCLFDDPLIFLAILGLLNFNERTKIWYSVACEADFKPVGRSFATRLVRACFDVANLIYVSRVKRRGHLSHVCGGTLRAFAARADERLRSRIAARARKLGTDADSYVTSFLTTSEDHASDDRISPLNQVGLLEACVRADTGDWIHIFPEGERSRSLQLRRAHAGLGKVLYYTDPLVIPICVYGTQDILPIEALVPRLYKHVAVTVGQPVERRALSRWREGPATIATFHTLAEVAMNGVAHLRRPTLDRYFGRTSTGSPTEIAPPNRSASQ